MTPNSRKALLQANENEVNTLSDCTVIGGSCAVEVAVEVKR
jgi:hypothetical protein